MKEYDPEWGRAFWEGSVFASCDHARMLRASSARCCTRTTFASSMKTDGHLLGAASDVQAKRVCELVAQTGNSIEYKSFPRTPHSMHGEDPKVFAPLIVEFDTKLKALGR